MITMPNLALNGAPANSFTSLAVLDDASDAAVAVTFPAILASFG
jgi:hypothetical protein